MSPEDGTGSGIAKSLYSIVEGTEAVNNVVVIGSDGTATMTGKHSGALRCLEELLERPLVLAFACFMLMNSP